MRKPKRQTWWADKEAADALEKQIKDLEYLLKFSRGDDERRPILEDIALLDERLCEYYC